MAATPDARVPRHLAIVMDGNGRWAKQRLRPRTFGHHAGQKAVKEAVEFCLRRGITSLTLFAFSSENCKRPPTEVSALMELFLKALDREVNELHGNGVRIRFVGDLDAFAPELRARMLGEMDRTAGNTALNMNVAVNYGGRWDIANASRLAAEAIARGEFAAADLDEAQLNRYTCLADQPPLDLFIRTGGEHRVSNFLLWQLAYAELYFPAPLWPAVAQACLAEAIDDYARRERRYG